eukprot:CAMPEP_0202692300 /NCGR_PEP_ID=MMETSP1385-20130828/6709_1 /ASSEMBLY_ACC=CAM_ASM_000861 /TAXON_ID=933848 /ORGANISM="Elphidium margaritaceum" /LENGTH=438 /DNA_ID=CAMNT_0049347807 /DNA_START=21 /DNA_END=1337 /DNA_ORIENTATION=+
MATTSNEDNETDHTKVLGGTPSRLPYPLNQLENKQRVTFRDGEFLHYLVFWSSAAGVAGIALGCLSSYRRHRYRKWVHKQPQAVQLKILEKQGVLASGIHNESPGLATARFTTLPNAMDTRPSLPYSGEYRPYQWYQFGPIKLWNNLSNYPWASEMFVELSKWMARTTLLCGGTLALECGMCALLGYPLGVNAYIRGSAGFMSGWLIASMASEGVLYYYQTFGIAALCGLLWYAVTKYDSHWGDYARQYVYLIEMYSPMVHRRMQRYNASKDIALQLFSKNVQEKHEVYEEFLAKKEEAIKQYGKPMVEEEERQLKIAKMSDVQQSKMLKWWFEKKSKNIEVSKEIDEMPYEVRKQLEQKVIGDRIAVDFSRYPFKHLAQTPPVFYVMDKAKYRMQNDTARLVHQVSQGQARKCAMNSNQDDFQLNNVHNYKNLATLS